MACSGAASTGGSSPRARGWGCSAFRGTSGSAVGGSAVRTKVGRGWTTQVVLGDSVLIWASALNPEGSGCAFEYTESKQKEFKARWPGMPETSPGI